MLNNHIIIIILIMTSSNNSIFIMCSKIPSKQITNYINEYISK